VSTSDESSIQGAADSISAALGSSDGQSAQRLTTLGLVHQARVSQLQRNAAAVGTLFGAKSTQAATAQAATASGRASVARLGALRQQLDTPEPEVPSGGWVLHGRVYDDSAAPVAAQTVFLVDGQGTYQRAYGFAYTDDTGYFTLTAPGDATEEGATAEPELYLSVVNAKRQPVYLAQTAFQPTVGAATYQTVQLAAGGKAIGDPPQAVRASAIPRAQRPPTKPKGTAARSPKRSTRKPKGES
jgi:hypothetical protein